MFKSFILHALGFILLSTSFFSQRICAQDEITSQILVIGLLFRAEGYQLTHDIKMDRLYDSESDSYTFQLTRGVTYKLIGVCDNDCGDMDFYLYDENGNIVADDDRSDDMPVVTVTPRWSGSFRLKVVMFDCKREPCSIGIGIFGK